MEVKIKSIQIWELLDSRQKRECGEDYTLTLEYYNHRKDENDHVIFINDNIISGQGSLSFSVYHKDSEFKILLDFFN